MPSLNNDSFKKFIEVHGTVTFAQATTYADIGDKIIKLAMKEENPIDYENKMQNLMEEYQSTIGNNVAKHCYSNMASCLLYAQTRDNFDLKQGFGKGANINQYGDKKQSERTVRNLMTFFSQKRKPNQKCGYVRSSTHGKWRNRTQSKGKGNDVCEMKLGVDIDNNPKTGSIPAPLKGIHTAHFVSGVDKNGVVKLLIKPENWGMQMFEHTILHVLDWIKTRFSPHKVKDLENRQETKSTKESIVINGARELRTDLLGIQENITNQEIKLLLASTDQVLKSLAAGKVKGFKEPLNSLIAINFRLDKWAKNNPDDQNLKAIEHFKTKILKKIDSVEKRYLEKYSSECQYGSEVRLSYNNDGQAENDTSGQQTLKQRLADLREQATTDQERQPPSPGT